MIKTKIVRALLPAVIFAAACTDNEQFRINGTIDSNTSTNIIVAYRSNGAYRSEMCAVREGKFEFFASSSQPALVEIFDHNFRAIARLYAANGETFEIAVNSAEPFLSKVSGNDISERYGAFINQNAAALARGGKDANDAIADYVGRHTNDIVSTLLLITQYDASTDAHRADSLMSLIEPAARPSALTESNNYMMQRLVASTATGKIGSLRYCDHNDSSRVLMPSQAKATLIAFDRSGDFRVDSTVPALDRLVRRFKKNINILEIDLEPYGSTVRNKVADSCRWTLGRVPGGLASTALDTLGIPFEPYFIVTDSTGQQVYRGGQAATAAAVAANILQ